MGVNRDANQGLARGIRSWWNEPGLESMKSWILVLVGLVVIGGIAIGLGGWLSRERAVSAEAADSISLDESTRPGGTGKGSISRPSRSQPAGRSSRLSAGPTDEEEAGETAAGDKLSAKAIETYVATKGRSSESLLAAFSASQDKKYLKEAAGRFPDNPQIQLAMILNPSSPEEQRAWLERYKQTDRSNAIGYYLSAMDLFRQQNPQAALQELNQANGLGLFNNYRRDQALQIEDLYLASGRSAAEAKTAAMQGTSSMQLLSYVKELSGQMAELQQQYAQANDADSAIALAGMGVQLARRLNFEGAGSLMIDQLVGIAIEQRFLSQLNSSSQPDYLGKPVTQRIAELRKQQEDFKQQAEYLNQYFESQSNEAMRMEYLQRVETQGEAAALRWLRSTEANP